MGAHGGEEEQPAAWQHGARAAASSDVRVRASNDDASTHRQPIPQNGCIVSDWDSKTFV